MIIGIDGNEANIGERVGVNTYGYELLKNIKKLQEKKVIKDKLIVYLRNDPIGDMPKAGDLLEYKVLRGGRMWVLTKLMPELYFGKTKCDIFFSPNHYGPVFSPMPHVCSIMDLGYLKFSEQFKKNDFWQLKVWSAISIFTSKAIIAISNSTKDDIVRHHPWVARKIYVTPLAYDAERFNADISEKDVRRVKERYSIVSDYVLYLGTLKPSKNIEGLIEAFSQISHLRSSISLIIAGKKGWKYESVFERVKTLGLKDKVIFTGFVPEEDKPALIKGAVAFALPSFWEGFGLDALNAMACGVPVIVSETGSLPEVVGGAGILVDPKSVKSIAGGILRVLSMGKSEYNSIVAKGLAQAKEFSWEKTALETLKILENLK
jgi:glycosyltransferase involved in cell wall biosynthesis